MTLFQRTVHRCWVEMVLRRPWWTQVLLNTDTVSHVRQPSCTVCLLKADFVYSEVHPACESFCQNLSGVALWRGVASLSMGNVQQPCIVMSLCIWGPADHGECQSQSVIRHAKVCKWWSYWMIIHLCGLLNLQILTFFPPVRRAGNTAPKFNVSLGKCFKKKSHLKIHDLVSPLGKPKG